MLGNSHDKQINDAIAYERSFFFKPTSKVRALSIELPSSTGCID